eukprot:XP_003972604.2 PREDICTED: inositol 1,4,5-trisphosphate receptor-interacting protein-like [Takifugu rubripes]
MVKTGCVQEACAICTLHRKVSQQSSSCAGNKSRQTTFTTSKIGRDRRYCARRTEMLLRVFVVALSLLYLCDDPGLEELEDVTTINMQDGKELRRDGAQPHHKMAPVIQEVTHQPCSHDASVSKPEKGGDRDNLKESQHVQTNVNQETSRAVQAPMREDVSLSPNQSGSTDGSRRQKHHVTSSKEAIAAGEWGDLWCLWNTFSILSMIHIVRKYLGRAFQHQIPPVLATHPACEVALPDSKTLQQFHSRCIRGLSVKRIWEIAFLEGFVNDLLEVMRSVCDRSGGVAIEGFQMDNVRNIIVPFTPLEPYRFQCFLLKDQLDMQVCGQIKLVETLSRSCCHCQSSHAEEVLCLLHWDAKRSDVCGSLSTKDSLLSKSQVTKWFQSTIKQAWEIISHRYQFEVNIGYVDTPGALRVRFRSGKVVNFTMNPVVKFNTDTYFFRSHTTSCSDTIWTLSLEGYEERFFKQMTRYLPVNSCFNQTLEIALFLHRRQTLLTGGSELKDSHFKMALMHLLLIRDPSQWEPSHLEHRLRDLLDFLDKSLEKKTLHHVLVGNPLIRKVAEVPAEFVQADSVNLFHPLMIHDCLHRNAVKHFQEILRNARMLVDDYVHLCSGPVAQ